MEGPSPVSHHDLDVRREGSSIKNLRTLKAREKPKLWVSLTYGSYLITFIWTHMSWGVSVGRGAKLEK